MSKGRAEPSTMWAEVAQVVARAVTRVAAPESLMLEAGAAGCGAARARGWRVRE